MSQSSTVEWLYYTVNYWSCVRLVMARGCCTVKIYKISQSQIKIFLRTKTQTYAKIPDIAVCNHLKKDIYIYIQTSLKVGNNPAIFRHERSKLGRRQRNSMTLFLRSLNCLSSGHRSDNRYKSTATIEIPCYSDKVDHIWGVEGGIKRDVLSQYHKLRTSWQNAIYIAVSWERFVLQVWMAWI